MKLLQRLLGREDGEEPEDDAVAAARAEGRAEAQAEEEAAVRVDQAGGRGRDALEAARKSRERFWSEVDAADRVMAGKPAGRAREGK